MKLNITGALPFFLFFLNFTALTLQLNAQEYYLPVKYIDLDGSRVREKFPESVAIESLDSVLSQVKLTYQNWGYFGCSIDSVLQKNDQLCIYIFKGIKYKIIAFKTDSTSLRKAHKRYVFKPLFNWQNLKAIDQRVLISIQEKGYPFAVLNKQLSFKGNKASILYRADLNNYVVYDSLKVEPNNLVSYAYLTKATNIKTGQPFNLKQVSQIKANLNRSGFLTVDSIYRHIYNDRAVVALKVKSESQNTFSGLVGLQQGESGKAEITGNVSLNLLNVFRQGEAIDFFWQKPGKESQQLTVNYLHPYVFNLPAGIFLGGNFYKQDTLYTNAVFEFGATVPTFYHGILSLNTKWTNSTVDALEGTELQNSKTFVYGMGYRLNKADGIILLKKGVLANAKLLVGKYTNNAEWGESETFYSEGFFDFAWANKLPFGVLYFKNTSAYILNDSIALNSIYRVGGATSMRGFYENAIYAKNYTYCNLEYRFFIGSKSYFYFLYDFGTFDEPVTTDYAWQFRQALGAGLSINTKAGELTMSYAVGKLNNNPFLLNQSKIHIGYINYF